jgi:SH3 domain-containing YSC84-like protein 1
MSRVSQGLNRRRLMRLTPARLALEMISRALMRDEWDDPAMRRFYMKKFLSMVCLLGLVLATAALPALADTTKAEAQKEVAAAGKTLDTFVADPDIPWLRAHAKEAKGLLICSKVAKAGFVFGGSGGRCVLIVKGEKGWNGPAFYTIGTASVGFQAGVEVAELAILVQTQKGLDSLMSSAFKVGGDVSASAGPVGAGTGATVKEDLVVYSRSKGVFAGVDISGSSIKPTEDYNNVYYGKNVSPIDIIVRGNVHNPSAKAALLSKAEKLYEAK